MLSQITQHRMHLHTSTPYHITWCLCLVFRRSAILTVSLNRRWSFEHGTTIQMTHDPVSNAALCVHFNHLSSLTILISAIQFAIYNKFNNKLIPPELVHSYLFLSALYRRTIQINTPVYRYYPHLKTSIQQYQ